VLWRPAVSGVEVLHAHFHRHEYPRHAHEATTVALVDSGAATFNYRGERFVAPAGTVFFINEGGVHTGRPADPDGYRYRVLYLDLPALRSFGWGHPARRAPSFRETVAWDRELSDLLHRTHRALSGDGPRLLQEELLLRVAGVLFDRYGEIAGRRTRARDGGHRAVSAARAYLESHLAEKVSLNDLASVTALSPYRLVRTFSSELGMPPHAYQTQLRVRLARRLLAAGTPIAHVASQVGFCDQAHLTRVFKRYTGVTPCQFSMGARPGAADGVDRAG
jgi:AraC-like DNA-binding protein